MAGRLAWGRAAAIPAGFAGPHHPPGIGPGADEAAPGDSAGRWTLAESLAMTSLSGDAVKVGHRFSYDVSTLSALTSDDFSSPFYTFSGFLWTQSGATKKLAFSSTQENNALTLVRVK